MNRVTVTIDGKAYTIIAEEDESYIRRSAELVDKSIAETKAQSGFRRWTAAVLAALNIADKY